ncbi:hypothetical protein IE4803_PC00184 (plasmid) [Rhizobium etli bv. phaseoli str. IE4803]|nr:hypothetical protein IE4803_PC00184 [Rhizobium etli bv. phaseoli str. IE4803]
MDSFYYSSIMDACLFYWNNLSSAIRAELSMGHAEKTRSSARGDFFGSAAFFLRFPADHWLRSERFGLPKGIEANRAAILARMQIQRGRPSAFWRTRL